MNFRVRPAFYRDIAHQELWLLEHAGSEIANRWHEALGKASNSSDNTRSSGANDSI
jgi:hypothetical protein